MGKDTKTVSLREAEKKLRDHYGYENDEALSYLHSTGQCYIGGTKYVLSDKDRKISQIGEENYNAVYNNKIRGGDKRGGKNMAVKVQNKNGKVVTLLNPSEKGGKYARELKSGIRYTNDGMIKIDENGYASGLTESQRAYRSGYLAAQKDSANCYKAKTGKKSKRGNRLPAKY